jgi:hypothetical protein
MLKLMLDLMRLMKLGEEVGNPRLWKKGQVAMNALAGMLLIGISYLPIPPEYASFFTEEVLDYICDFIVGVVLFVNALLVFVHSKKIGV